MNSQCIPSIHQLEDLISHPVKNTSLIHLTWNKHYLIAIGLIDNVYISISLVNPVTGEEIGQPGQFYTPPREHAAPQSVGTQERLKNRIPPGGFSSPLW